MISYKKLFLMMEEREISKEKLKNEIGISSATMAKLSKNETVTTDTLARICTALHCDVGDVMECVSEENLSLYACYKKRGVCTQKNEQYKTVCFTVQDQKYTVYVSKRSAGKFIVIAMARYTGRSFIAWEGILQRPAKRLYWSSRGPYRAKP